MIHQTTTDISRIDKLPLDLHGVAPRESRVLRATSVPTLSAGADCAISEALQVALLTAANLAHKSFSAAVPVETLDSVWTAPCLTALSAKLILGEALEDIGAVRAEPTNSPLLKLLIGDAPAGPRSLRVTFDGWRVGVGPATATPRLKERAYCMLAPLAAAAIAVGEAFSAWANISIEATRKTISFSLWRPDLDPAQEEALGRPVEEFPKSLELFGLGHLGQAYVWAIAALPFEDRHALLPYLCDDDAVELPNLETGALLHQENLPGRKTRVISEWLQQRGFDSRLVERFIDSEFHRCSSEPTIALSGFDNNEARQWLAHACFSSIVDSGLGGEATNFDTISIRSWPNAQPPEELWPLEDDAMREARELKQKQRTKSNSAYEEIAADECGRLLVARKSVAVPFVGAVAAAFVIAEVLRGTNGGPVFSDCKLRVCSLANRPVAARLEAAQAPPRRGLETARLRNSGGL